MLILIVTGATVLFLATGALGADALSTSGNPLVEALGDSGAAKAVNYIGLAGLVASFFSIMYAYSRQTFALSRAGYLPKNLSVTNKRKAPLSRSSFPESSASRSLSPVKVPCCSTWRCSARQSATS